MNLRRLLSQAGLLFAGFVIVSPMGRLREWHPSTNPDTSATTDSATRPNSATTVSSP